MAKVGKVVVTLLASGLIAAGVYAVLQRPATVVQQKGGRWAADGPVPVRVADVVTTDVPVYIDAVGTARALNTVAVQPQVGGKIREIAFKEGQTVEKGQVLARIDPATFQAALDQAKAKLSQDESQLANAKVDLDRYVRIPGAIPVKTVDTQRALVAQLTGQVASSKAAVDAAQVQLDYTNIVAPITGRTGIRQVDEGNIVGASSSTLVTITQVQPISVIFNVPQQRLAEVNRAITSEAVAVDALEADNKTPIDAGRLQVVDNQVDQATGTVRMKAEFPNAKLQLWPGQFVNVRVLINTLKDAVTVPTAAVQRGPAGTFVYVATADNKVAMRPVVVPQQDDVRAVLASGVVTGDRVVTSGFARLKEGTAVAVATTEELEKAPQAPKRESQKGQGKRKRDGAASPDGQPSAGGTDKGNGERKRGEGRRKRDQSAPPAPSADAAPAVPPAGATDASPSIGAAVSPEAPAAAGDGTSQFKNRIGQKAPEVAPQ